MCGRFTQQRPTAELAELFAELPLGISVEMQELDANLSLKKNNLHEYVKARSAKTASTA